MARTAKADYRALMTQVARRRLERGEDVAITSVAAELDVSPGLVHFYFGDRQSLINAAWQEILMAHVSDDLATVNQLTAHADWAGVRTLTDRVFSEGRDDIHLAHVRASVASQFDTDLAEIFDHVTAITTRYWEKQIHEAVTLDVARTDLDLHALSILIMAVPLGVATAKPRLTAEERVALSEAWSTMVRAVLEPEYTPPGHSTEVRSSNESHGSRQRSDGVHPASDQD